MVSTAAGKSARPLVGKVKHHIVSLLAQRLNELPLHLQLMLFPEASPPVLALLPHRAGRHPTA
jgi:hypothetical protein